MAIGANSYGSVTGVAALSRRWTNESETFDLTTTPTLAQVESWIDQISSVINVTMAGCRYVTLPITQVTAVNMFGLYVNQMAADMVEGSHDLGRLGPTALTNQQTGSVRSMWKVVAGEVAQFIKDQCDAFEYLGIPREAVSSAKGRLNSSTIIRVDGYSDDLTATEATRFR